VKTTRSGQVASHYSVTTIVNNPQQLRRTSDAARVDTKTSEGA